MNNIIGLYHERRLLEKAILDNRLAGAYCFLGIEGVGKDAMAIEVAKVTNCYEPIITTEVDEQNNEYQSIAACEHCKSCKMANSLSHPNIQFIYSIPGGDKLSDEQHSAIKEEIKLKVEDKYHKMVIPNAKYINIQQIRDIKKRASLSTVSYGRRFIIISNGEQMNTEAANAFLKTLEEPQPDTTIIITSSKKEQLLQTILSRCQQIYFSPIPFDDMVTYLSSKHNKSNVEARLIATFAQGSISNALNFFDDSINSMRSQAVDTLRSALHRKEYRIELTNAIDNILKSKDKKMFGLFLNLLLIWVRDVYSIAVLRNTELVINLDLAERMVKFHNGYPDANLLNAISKIEQAIGRIERNVDPKMTFTALFIELRRIFLQIDY
ncbi:MAG: hypothetical protein LBO69_08520 [Ignavibacteria bacterium]|jgi:DNA polymerase-3 subunit delta'|nr:hypothetical protein [Ignavibacteria bacterium]